MEDVLTSDIGITSGTDVDYLPEYKGSKTPSNHIPSLRILSQYSTIIQKEGESELSYLRRVRDSFSEIEDGERAINILKSYQHIL